MPTASGRVLLVDDEEAIRDLVSSHLAEQGWECHTACDGQAALDLARATRFDAVLTDVRMPGLDGLALSRELHLAIPALPVIVVTAVASFDSAVRALKHGAFDYIVKPFQLEALDAALARAVEHRRGIEGETARAGAHVGEDSVVVRSDEAQTRRLVRKARRLRATNERLRGSFEEMARVWVGTLEARRLEPRNHCRRVRAYAVLAARRLGLSSAEVRAVSLGSLLHHVGLLYLPERVVRARHELSPEHRELLDGHPIAGHQMLAGVQLLAGAAEVVAAHHEHFDGSGAPRGLRGDEIPVGARCFAVADAADAVLRVQPGVTSAALQRVESVLSEGSGSLLDPDIVGAFLHVPRRDLERETARFPHVDPVASTLAAPERRHAARRAPQAHA